jgi:hypothetical protein
MVNILNLLLFDKVNDIMQTKNFLNACSFSQLIFLGSLSSHNLNLLKVFFEGKGVH